MSNHLRHPRRRRAAALAALAVVGVLLAGCSSSPSGSSTDTAKVKPLPTASIQLGWLPNVESMAPIVAQQKGYYKKAGIDVTLLPGGPNVTTPAEIASGKVLMGYLPSEGLANAVKEGAPLVGIGATYQSSSSAIITLASSDIKAPKDLEGKTFGMAQSDDPVYTPFFKLVGVDPSKITKVMTNADSSALLDGQVQAMSGTLPNQPIALEAAGAKVRTIPLADYGYNRWSDILVVSKAALADPQKRATIVALLKATTGGLQFSVKDPKAAAQIVYDADGKQQGLVLAQQQAAAAVWAQLATKGHSGVMKVTSSGLAQQQKFYDTIGIKVKATSLYDLSVQGAE